MIEDLLAIVRASVVGEIVVSESRSLYGVPGHAYVARHRCDARNALLVTTSAACALLAAGAELGSR